MSYWEDLYSGMSGGHPSDDDCDGWLAAHRQALAKGARVLDLGCGRGANIPGLLDMGLRVTAADFSPSAVRLAAQAYRQIETVCFDMTKPFPFETGAFHAVVADLSLHYFSWQDTQRIVDEIARVLVPGGRLIARVHSVKNVDATGLEVIEPNYYVSQGYPRRYFTLEDIEKLFAAWMHVDAWETQIVRFGRTKQVIELEAQTNR